MDVLPVDQLPLVVPINLPCFYVVNTAPSMEPGKHWVLLFIQSKDESYFFDSYGFPPEFWSTEFTDYFKRNCIDPWYNHIQLQTMNSSSCGYWCLFVADQLCRNYKYILERTTNYRRLGRSTLLRNQHYMVRWTQRHYNLIQEKCTKSVCDCQLCVTMCHALQYKYASLM